MLREANARRGIGRPLTPAAARGWAQSGVAMITAMLAIFILTVTVAALALATMGETALSFDQAHSAQALHLAEAGAYRALAELRHRMSVVVRDNVINADPLVIQGRCNSNQGWRFLVDYGGPGWTDEGANRRAVLAIGAPGSEIQVRDGAGNVVGNFYATIYVRPTFNAPGPGPNQCNPGGPGGVQSWRFYFDYFIVATGAARNSRRTICLKNPGNNANCGAWVASAGGLPPDPSDPTWDTAPADHGWQVFVYNPSYTRWALMLLGTSNTWLTSAAVLNGPAHTNDRFQIWGNPTFESGVTQVGNQVLFGNGGAPVLLAAEDNCGAPQPDCPVYQGSRMLRNVAPIPPPADDSPAWAALNDTTSRGIPPAAQVRQRTTQLLDTGTPIPDGIYVMDQCVGSTCGGIWVEGDVHNLVLDCEPAPCGASSNQTIMIVHASAVASPQTMKLVLDRSTNTVWRCPAPSFSCTDTGKAFNGMLYVNGSITSTAGDGTSGLYGYVQETTRLTIAADGEITVTNHLVYQSPPTGPTDPIPNVLGLYAWCSDVAANACNSGPARNVTVDGALAPNDLFIDAAVLAPWGQFWVEGWDTLPDKGPLRLLGGAVQKDMGPWGGFRFVGATMVRTGYRREMNYDDRFLTNNAPPFMPLTSTYTADRSILTIDVLYDRPLWEEILEP